MLRSTENSAPSACHTIRPCTPRPSAFLESGSPARRCRDLLALRQTFHKWYFAEGAGGMFLTEAGRDAYFALQNQLQVAGAGGSQQAGPVTSEEFVRLRDLAHKLRQQLRQDLGTAEAPKVVWTARGATPAAPLKQKDVGAS